MKKKRRGRRKKDKRKKGKKKKEETEIEGLMDEEEEHGDYKLKSSKANEWGKLAWNWNNINEGECEEKRRRKLKNMKRDHWIRNGRKKRGNEKQQQEKGEMSRNIEQLRKSLCNWDMKRKRRVRKKKMKRRKKRKRGRNSGKGRGTDDKFKWSKTNEWGKLNWNNKNEEEFEETDEEICKIGKKKIAGLEMQDEEE